MKVLFMLYLLMSAVRSVNFGETVTFQMSGVRCTPIWEQSGSSVTYEMCTDLSTGDSWLQPYITMVLPGLPVDSTADI